MVMAAAEEIVLEIVPEEDVLRLRAGQKIIAFAALEDRSLAKLSHVGRSYAGETRCDLSTLRETEAIACGHSLGALQRHSSPS